MSSTYIIRHGTDECRSTVLVRKDGTVCELRKGHKTYRVGSIAQRSWPNLDQWISDESIDRNLLKIPETIVSKDCQKVVEILATFLRRPNMYRSASCMSGYKYAIDSYLFVMDMGRLIPFYVCGSDGTMLYKYTTGKTFADLELVNPEFWVQDRGNQIIKFTE
jgi:hypothetical protein